MGSLSGCIAKAGALLSAKDRATLNEAALKMRAAGGDRVEAEKTAVAQVIESLRKAEPKEATRVGVAFDPRRVFDQGGARPAQTDTPEFKAWFGDSKVVDAQGKPLVVYHGTGGDFGTFDFGKMYAGEGASQTGSGFYFTTSADSASRYAALAVTKDQPGNVMPVYLAIKNPLHIDFATGETTGAALTLTKAQVRKIIMSRPNIHSTEDSPLLNFGDVAYEGFEKVLREAIGAYAGGNNIAALRNDFFGDDHAAWLRSLAEATGHDGAVATTTNGDTHWVAWRPEQIKSIFNRGTFDPNDPSILQQGGPAPTFFSALGRAVESADMKAAPAAGWDGAIKGWISKGLVKADEVEWTGLREWLALQQGKVTREQVAEFIRSNGVKVEEVTLGGAGAMPTGATKYSQYILPGGTNYREVLLTLPDNETAFRSSHWDQSNILAHIRLNDRVDADGKRVLFVEEIQSDWGQAAKKKGIREEQERRLADLVARRDAAKTDVESEAIQRQISELGRSDPGVPSAPFIGSTDKWLTLALKRVMAMAAQEGYDRVAFINGEQSAERYDLSKQVESISYRKDGEQFRVRAKSIGGGEMVDLGTMKTEELEGAVGKDVAKKIIDGDGVKSGDMTILRGVDLKVGGEGMRAFYDKIVPSALKDVLKKVGGGAVTAVALDSRSPATRELDAKKPGLMPKSQLTQPGFDITPAMREKVAGGMPLFQGGGEPLGGYDPASRTMIFTPRSNLSTALHESAHHFLELSRAFASAPDAPAQIKADFDILLRTYGVKGDTPEARLADWNGRDLESQRAVHERFATEFERYLFEGKAPTQALQPLFSRLRTWMVALYQRLMGSPQGLPDLSPEVRGVMDRMLASEAAIKDAEASRAYAPLPKEAFGGDAKAYQDYLDLGMRATERAVDEMTQRSIKDMQWASGAKTKALKQLQAQHNASRKAIAEQVEAEWSESPAVRAEAALRDAHAQGRVEPGVDEAIALASGFRDADDMYAAVGAIRDRGGVAAARDDFVRADTDRRMLIEHGDLVDPKAIDEAANAAVHNGARARFLATGLKVLTKSPVPVAELVRAAKETAAGMIGERKIGDLRVDTYLASERRANKEVLAKVAKDPAAAIEAQRQAMLANRLAKTALDARAEVDKGLAYLKKMADGPDSIAIDARDQITAILERFQLGGTRKRADTMRTLAQWIEGQKELGLEPDIPPEIMAEAFRTNYRDLTVDQFRGLVDSIKQIEHLGRLENRLLTARRQETFAQARDAMVESVVANASGRVAEVRSSNTVTGRALEGMRDFWASHITAAMFARRFDGGKDGGVVWEHLIRPANERGHWEVEMRAKATRDLVDIMKPVFALGRMGGNGEMFPSIGRKLNRQARLAFALNAGNEGNLQRLLDGNGYTREQIQPVLESLTAAEWKAVQGVWDYMETFRPLIAAKERRVMGREPEWVEPTPFTVKTADGQTLRMKGGYYPIKYDPRASARAETHQLAEDIAQQMRGAYTSATTRRSFTKARVDEVHNRPLLESLDGIYSGVQDVIHDLAWHEYLIDANRLMRDEALSQTIRSTWGPEAHQQLRTWLTDVAAGEAAARQAGERAVSWVRQGVSIAGLGFNVMNAMLQPLGFTQSISRIGPQWVGRGVAKALGSPMETAGQISDMSPFMRTRFMTRFRELNELRNVVQGQSKARSALDAGAYALMLRFQQLVDIPTWWGAYEKAIAEGNDQGRAAALADQAIIDSQGSGMVKDMASVMRGGQFQKLFTSFYSFFNTTFNLAAERTASSQNKAALAAQYLLLFALPATMAAALKDALTPGESDDWSEEKIARKLLGENLGYLLNTMFLVRELGNPVSQSVKGEPFGTDYSGPAGLRMIGDVSKVISKITKPNEVEWNDSLRKAVVNLAGDLARLPAAQINRTITGVQALREGKTSNPAAVLFGYQEPR